MNRWLVTGLLVASFLLGTTLLGQKRFPASGSTSLAAATSAASTSSANASVAGIRCVCTCGINCDGSCTFDTGSCIYVGDALKCVANCCAAAPKPGPNDICIEL